METLLNHKKDDVLRSLLQKAVRRSQLFILLETMNQLIKNNDQDFLIKRLPVILFEEAWHLANVIELDENIDNVLNNYIRICLSYKNKKIAGLASLYDIIVSKHFLLDDSHSREDYDYISEVFDNTKGSIGGDFYFNNLCRVAKEQGASSLFLKNCMIARKNANLFHDELYPIIALNVFIEDKHIPEEKHIGEEDVLKFPFWIAIDKHTKKGKETITEAANKLRINPEKALAVSFWLEGGNCYPQMYSRWYDKAVQHKMKSIGYTLEQARQIWEQLSPLIKHSLDKESKKLEKVMMKKVIGYNFEE